jgi:hypothetical protein
MSFGGLGFRKMKDVNLALVSKLGWKLHTRSESMWVSQLSGKYLLSGSFLSPLPILLPHGSGNAFFFLSILSLKVPVIEFILYLLCLSGIPPGFLLFLLSLHPLLFSSPPPNLVIFELITPNASWNLSLLIFLFDSSSVKEIQKIKIHPNPIIDLWTPSPNGAFFSSLA